jgi:hypothetical protein
VAEFALTGKGNPPSFRVSHNQIVGILSVIICIIGNYLHSFCELNVMKGFFEELHILICILIFFDLFAQGEGVPCKAPFPI